MKVAGGGRLFKEDGFNAMAESVNYVLSLPVSTVIIGITKLDEIDENARLARNFKPLPADQMKKIEEMFRPHADTATFFKREW